MTTRSDKDLGMDQPIASRHARQSPWLFRSSARATRFAFARRIDRRYRGVVRPHCRRRGISGLAAAHFFRTNSPRGRVLVLDNHDDFGGHAKRNEFHVNGRMHLMNGGTLSIESPRPYGTVLRVRNVGNDRVEVIYSRSGHLNRTTGRQCVCRCARRVLLELRIERSGRHRRIQKCPLALPEREQHKVGRAELLATPFETFERQIRDELGRALGGGGFDPARDIEGIAVNRWPHGYAPEYNFLVDGDTPPEKMPNVIGRIAIANSDAGMGAYTDVAIEQAHRAVHELQRIVA